MRWKKVINVVDCHAAGEVGKVIKGVGVLTVDVAYGGMTYVLTDAKARGFDIVPSRGA